MNKDAEMSWFVVSIIIAIMVLVVFVLFALLFPKDIIDRSACHTSIVLRATVPNMIVDAKSALSLKCKTMDVCITTKSGKGNCTGLGKKFETMRLTGSDVDEQKNQIKMFLAREMADCWNMFGEGKLNIFSGEITTKQYLSRGIICSKIEFDNSVLYGKDKNKDTLSDNIEKIEGLSYYMVTHKVPNNNYSYMDYLRGTPEGESARQLYGQELISSGADMRKNDVLYLSGVKTIFYIESTLTKLPELLGGIVGGGVGLFGVVKTGGLIGGKLSGLLVAGGVYLGGRIGNTIFKALEIDDGFCVEEKNEKKCNDHVGGLFLTDYSPMGFSKFKIDSFENI